MGFQSIRTSSLVGVSVNQDSVGVAVDKNFKLSVVSGKGPLARRWIPREGPLSDNFSQFKVQLVTISVSFTTF